MFETVFWSVASALLAGLLLKFAVEKYTKKEFEITWVEYGAGSLLILVVVAPLTAMAGWHFAKDNHLSYNEYWNGWELQALPEPISCTRDGSCRWDYDCDPYIVMVPYSCNCHSVSCGKDCSTTECDTCYRPETRYHSCPYVNEETTYIVKTTLGDYTIGEHRFPLDPQQNRWRMSEVIPQYIIERAGVGEPPFWTEAKKRIGAGKPGPVTKRVVYKNYILASDQTILKQYSNQIQQYLDAKLLPPVQHDVHDYYWADKVQFVGISVPNPQDWQMRTNYLNAGLGTELQGDLHLVLVNNNLVSNPDSYILALKAYWMNSKVFGDDAISKNSIIVVLGTDGQKVVWARAMTGMPLGNELMLVKIQEQLKGVSLTSESVIGIVSGSFYEKEKDGKKQLAVKGEHNSGLLERVLWGLSDPSTIFKRVCMTCTDKGESGGFLYLDSQIQPTDGEKKGIIAITFILACLVWLGFAWYGQSYGRPYSTSRY